MAASLLRTLPKDVASQEYAEKEEVVINVAGIAYAAGADTVRSSHLLIRNANAY